MPLLMIKFTSNVINALKLNAIRANNGKKFDEFCIHTFV